MMLRAAAIIVAAMLLGPSVGRAEFKVVAEVTSFDRLSGWAQDDHAAALEVFLKTCKDLSEPDWAALCELARTRPNARAFFETFFRPVMIDDGDLSLVTGYFEPELRGSLVRTSEFSVPVYKMPPELAEGGKWYDRRTIETGSIMAGRGLELAWVSDPTALFYMQVQGSGRILLTNGTVLRLGYAGSNGHEFRSPGVMLAEQGIYDPHKVSASVVGHWVRRNPGAGAELLRASPNYVFFRKISGAGPDDGPRGAMNRPITAERTLAVDPAYIQLGAPVWMEKGGETVIRRLMVAQDTGSAIKGAQRADLYMGTGTEAGRAAQRLRDPARLFVLLPIERAHAVADQAN